MRFKPMIILIMLSVICSIMVLFSSLSLAQGTGTILYGEIVSGEVNDPSGQEWTFQGCQHDVTTITVQSDEFSPYLELYDSSSEFPLMEGESSIDTMSAQIVGYSLARNDTYTLLVAGSGIRDVGPYSLTLALSTTATAVEANTHRIRAGQRLTGEVTGRLGTAWLFHGCANEVVTITLESDDFVPYLQLYGPSGREPLAISTGSSTGIPALIGAFALPEQGFFTLVASGEARRDRGSYFLSMATIGSQRPTDVITDIITPNPPQASKSTSTLIPTATNTVTTRPDSVPACTVIVSSLNLRRGPGTNYEKFAGGLIQGTGLQPIARDANGAWLEVEVVGTDRVGWVSASVQYISCTGIDILNLPIGVIPQPPTPTFTPTPLPAPTATSTPIPQDTSLKPRGVVLGVPGGDPGDVEGDIYLDPAYYARFDPDDDDGSLFVRDQLYLELFVYDFDLQNLDFDDVERVDFEIDCPNDEEYFRTERTARYCAFGGGEPNCTVLQVQRGANLPDSSCVIESGRYDVTISAYPIDDNADRTQWLFDLYFELPGNNEPEEGNEPEEANEPDEGDSGSSDLFVNIAQVGFGNILVFQAVAYDPNVGNQDGDGIDHVDLKIFGPNGQVYFRREGTAAYCAFAGGEPDCNEFNLQENSHWPDNGPEIESGAYQLYAEAFANDGRSRSVSTTIDIE